MSYLYDPETKKALDTETERAKNEEKKAVTDVTMTNEDGVYTFKQTKDGKETEIGTVEAEQNNPVVEVKDSVVENNTDGYDFHTISETTSDGTSNEVGQFYAAQKQITGFSKSGTDTIINYIDQSGNLTSDYALNKSLYEGTKIASFFGNNIYIPLIRIFTEKLNISNSNLVTIHVPNIKKGQLVLFEFPYFSAYSLDNTQPAVILSLTFIFPKTIDFETLIPSTVMPFDLNSRCFKNLLFARKDISEQEISLSDITVIGTYLFNEYTNAEINVDHISDYKLTVLTSDNASE